MPAKYPPFSTGPKGGMTNPANDTRHNRIDPNKGGSPLGRFSGSTPSSAPGQGSNPGSQAGVSRTAATPASMRGGFGHQGRDRVHVRAGMSGARGGSGNPASRSGFKGVARGGAQTAETRISGHGGSPQTRSNIPAPTNRGGFGQSGQKGVPTGSQSNPQPSAGNTSGRSYSLIAGRFKRKPMGAQPSSGDAMGSYGSPPITSNT